MTDRRPDEVPRQARGSQREHTTQVDPMLGQGRASSWRIWSVGIAIAVILAVVIYGIGVQHETTDAAAPQSAQLPNGPSGEPGTALPTGRGDANVPQTSPGAVTTQGQGPGAQPKE